MSTAVAVARARRVLFVSGLQLYPPRSGGTLRSHGLVQALGRQGLDVRVHSLTGRKADYRARRPTSVQCWPGGTEEEVERGAWSLADWLGGYVFAEPPLWIAAHLRAAASSPGGRLLPRALREKLSWCDTVVADFPFCAPIFAAAAARGKRRVLSTHNVEHHLCGGGWRGGATRAVVRRLEIGAASACDLLVACCGEDARFFETHARVRDVCVVPNGIDVRRFHGLERLRAAARRDLGLPPATKVLLFTASRWGPNRDAFELLARFARERAALLAEHDLHFLVVGNVVASPQRAPGLTATGRVESVEPFFAAADAAINPLLSGAGTNVKMCEFIAARLPLLTTAFGARGFHLVDGETAFLFEPSTLAPALSAFARLCAGNPGLLRQAAADAYTRNERIVDMDACVQPLAEALA